MTSTPADPAELMGIHVERDSLRFELRVDREPLELAAPLGHGQKMALAHLAALHDHDPSCSDSVDVHVGVLRRCLKRLDAHVLGVLIQEDLEPSFWLRLATPTGPIELELELLQAVSLLVTRSFALHVRRVPSVDWDASLRELLDEPSDRRLPIRRRRHPDHGAED